MVALSDYPETRVSRRVWIKTVHRVLRVMFCLSAGDGNPHLSASQPHRDGGSTNQPSRSCADQRNFLPGLHWYSDVTRVFAYSVDGSAFDIEGSCEQRVTALSVPPVFPSRVRDRQDERAGDPDIRSYLDTG